MIHGVSTCGVGEAKGHGVHLDREFIGRLVELGQAKERGVKARFGHPNMCSTALGTYLGKFKNWREGTTYRDGHPVPSAIADLHLSERAKKAPGGDLYTYVLEMAENEPDVFGSSIVFTPGRCYKLSEEEDDSEMGKGDKDGDEDKDGKKGRKRKKVYPDDQEGWRSAPDPIFVEIEELHACDAVDDPAANDGLFSRFSEGMISAQVTEFLDLHPEVLTLLDNPEVVEALSLYGDRVDGFLTRYRTYRERADGATAEPNSAGETGIEIEKEHDMDLAKILADENFQALCTRLELSIPEEADETFVLSVYEKANEDAEVAKAALESAEAELAVAREELASKPDPIEPPVEPKPETALSAEEIEKRASEDPVVALLLEQNRQHQAALAEQGSQLSQMTAEKRVSLHAAALAEAEEAAALGKLTNAGVEAYAKLLLTSGGQRLVLDSEGCPQFEATDVSEAARALLATLPADAAVPLKERTTRVNGKAVQELRVVKDVKDGAEMTDDDVAAYARESAQMVGMGD